MAPNKINVIIYILISIFCCRCVDNSLDHDSNVSDLFRKGYNLRYQRQLGELVSILNDSLVNISYPNWYQTVVFIDINNEILDWELMREKNEIPGVPDDILFRIRICDTTLYINDVKSSLPQIIELGNNYIYNDTARIKRFSRKQFIPFLGDINKSKVSALIKVETHNENQLTLQEWNLLFNTFDKLIHIIENRKDTISFYKWNVPYHQLPFEKKMAVTEFANFSITIVFE